MANFTGLVMAPSDTRPVVFFKAIGGVVHSDGSGILNLTFASNALIILCGPSGSGKSTFAKRFFRKTQVVSSDECRALVCDDPENQRISPEAFELLHTIVRFRLKWNRLTVVDATNLTGEYRTPLLRIAAEFARPIYLILFTTNLETCLQHNVQRNRIVGRDIIALHHEKFAHIRESISGEPYKAIYTIGPEDFDGITISFAEIDKTTE